jgi:phage baseplate assembly protein W
MPIPQIIRVDPKDLQKSRSIGISIPFNQPKVFSKTLSTKSQIKSNLVNLLLTTRGERVLNPTFGTTFRRLLFEPLTDNLLDSVKENILISINTFIPEITVTSMDIIPDIDGNKVTAMVSYELKISKDKDKISIDFSTL